MQTNRDDGRKLKGRLRHAEGGGAQVVESLGPLVVPLAKPRFRTDWRSRAEAGRNKTLIDMQSSTGEYDDVYEFIQARKYVYLCVSLVEPGQEGIPAESYPKYKL